MMNCICVDASLTLKLVLPEPESPKVHTLWRRWIEEGCEIIAPWLWVYEVTSVLRNRVHRGLLSSQVGAQALQVLHAQGVKLLHGEGLHQIAWQLAEQFQRPAAYDSFYLALAQVMNCPLWTADERLYRGVKETLSFVRWVGEED